VQRDRLRAARALSQRFRAVTLLKGSGTVLCDIDGRVRINPTGGPRLATAGSGDVLAGVIGALIAQGLAAWDAACTGAYLHGAAADAAAGREVLPASAQADRIAWQLAALRSPTA
jgi:NAD(P)H-hydrate repair Nnr-like enzyme with NAD(P)H-hydrate dehydratase domain